MITMSKSQKTILKLCVHYSTQLLFRFRKVKYYKTRPLRMPSRAPSWGERPAFCTSSPSAPQVLGQRTPGPHLLREMALPSLCASSPLTAPLPAASLGVWLSLLVELPRSPGPALRMRSLRMQGALKTSLSEQPGSQFTVQVESCH